METNADTDLKHRLWYIISFLCEICSLCLLLDSGACGNTDEPPRYLAGCHNRRQNKDGFLCSVFSLDFWCIELYWILCILLYWTWQLRRRPQARSSWRRTCFAGVSEFENNCIVALQEKRARRKENQFIKTPQPTQPMSATSAAVNVLQLLDSCHISKFTSTEPHPSTSTGDSTISQVIGCQHCLRDDINLVTVELLPLMHCCLIYVSSVSGWRTVGS